jgi:hypothetical protein
VPNQQANTDFDNGELDSYEIDFDEIMAIRRLRTGTIQDEAQEFLVAQKGRLPRIAADLGISPNTLYDLAAGRRASWKSVVAEKVLRYKLLMGEALLSCQLKRIADSE